MPYEIKKGAGSCKASQWAVVKKGTDTSVGCHDTEASAKKHLAALYVNVVKKEGAAVSRTNLIEARTTATATPVDGQPGRFLIQLITPGWGSSGYYSAAVLEAAAKNRVFPAGLHMYIDHPGRDESYDRPERTLRDLAAVLAEDAKWDGSALLAEARVFGDFKTFLSERQADIGVSIRASADIDNGSAEGRTGVIVLELIESPSVDFVTHAGRGGKIAAISESEAMFSAGVARAQLAEARNVGQWIESRLHLCLTEIADDMFGQGYLTREERISLSTAVGDGLDAFTTSLEASQPQLYTRDLWADPTILAAAIGETTHVPVNPAGQSTTSQESEEDTMPQIEEARLRTLEEAHGRVPVLEGERDTAIGERDTARRQLAEVNARNAARPIVQAVFANATGLAPKTITRAVETVVAVAPLTDKGELDEAKLKDAAEAALKAAQDEAAEYAAAAGAGTVIGFGGGQQGGQVLTEADKDKRVASLFGHSEQKAG